MEATNVIFDETRLAVRLGIFFYTLSSKSEFHADWYSDSHIVLRGVYDLFQMKPVRCILFLSTFISTFLHVLGNYMPIIRRTYCIYATLVFFVLYGWLSGLL